MVEDNVINIILTSFIKVPLPSLPQHTVSPGWCAALLTGVIVLRKQVIFVSGGKIQLPFNKASKNLKYEKIENQK